MNEQHAPPPSVAPPARAPWRKRLLTPEGLRMLAGALAVGAVGAALGWQFWLKPQLEITRRRHDTTADVLYLYGQQVRYRQVNGTYASDLDALLAMGPEGAARKAHMGEHLDLATITIVGDAKKFKIEANVLDAQRTLVKIRGPIQDVPAPRGEGSEPRETGVGPGGDGRPLAPAPAPAAPPRAR